MAGEQSAANVLVALKRQVSTATPPGDTGADRLRITDSPGLVLNTALAQSNEKRADANRQKGRHSSRSVSGSYNTELTVGGAIDVLLEAIMRSTWAAGATDAFAGVFTSIDISSNVFTASAGDFIAEGYRVGQVIYLTGAEDPANNDRNLLVTAVTASTMTVEPVNGVALTDNAADTAGTFNRHGSVVNAAAPTDYAHYIEQVDQGIDASEAFDWCRVVGMSLNIVPSQPVTAQWTFQGLDRDLYSGGSSPYYTSPALTTGLAVVGDEIALRFNGSLVTLFTGLTLNFQIAASLQPVLGSKLSPDVFTNDLSIEGQATRVRADHSLLSLYDAETEFEIGVVLEERTAAAPFPAIGLFFPVVTIDGASAPAGGGDGAKVETHTLGFGTKPAGVTGYDSTIAVISSSTQ